MNFLTRKQTTPLAAPVDKTPLPRQLHYAVDLLRELVARDMKLRYKRSVLGVAWSLLNPLAQVLVLSFVFRFVLPTRIPNFTPFLFIGVLAWSWFSSSLHAATGAIVQNSVLIRRPNFPAAILPVVTVTTHLVHFLLALPILILFLILSDIQLTSALLSLPLVIAIQFMLTVGLGFFLATLQVSFRDTQYLLGIFLMLGFYLSPIFYQPRQIPEQYQSLYYLNPMVSLLDAYRAILLDGRFPDALPLALIATAAMVLLGLGLRTFTRASYRFVEEL